MYLQTYVCVKEKEVSYLDLYDVRGERTSDKWHSTGPKFSSDQTPDSLTNNISPHTCHVLYIQDAQSTWTVDDEDDNDNDND